MTDNDIIKALECCSEPVGINCVNCPLKKNCLDVNVCEIALDLINRQKAEIERYERENNSSFDKWKLLADRTNQRYAELYEEAKEVLKAEAVKEFAERLKEKESFHYDYYANIALNYIKTTDIDNILKETVGDAK